MDSNFIIILPGESDSHSLYFESKYNWTGLLVEPADSGLNFKNRKATTVLNCLAIKDRPHYVDFNLESALEIDTEKDVRTMGGIVMVKSDVVIHVNNLMSYHQEKSADTRTLQCLPLYTLLLALDNPTVNWFILDIEGAEFQVLQTIPWELVDIEMVSVETDLAGLVLPGSRDEIIDYMESQGFHHAASV